MKLVAGKGYKYNRCNKNYKAERGFIIAVCAYKFNNKARGTHQNEEDCLWDIQHAEMFSKNSSCRLISKVNEYILIHR